MFSFGVSVLSDGFEKLGSGGLASGDRWEDCDILELLFIVF